MPYIMSQNTNSNQAGKNPHQSVTHTSSGGAANRAKNVPTNPHGQQNRPNGQFSAQDLNRIVLEYLNKKGYHRTEAMLRAESSRTLTPQNKKFLSTAKNGVLPEPSTEPPNPEKSAKPVSNPPTAPSAAGKTPGTQADKAQQQQQAQTSTGGGATVSKKRDSRGNVVSVEELDKEVSPDRYVRVYVLLKRWVDSSLEIYRPELNSMMYPIFIYLFLKLVAMDRIIARRFFDKFSSDFSIQHGTEINRLFSVNSVDHIKENDVAHAFESNKYRVTLSRNTLNILLYFLSENEAVGGSLIIGIINSHIQPNVVSSVTSRDRLADGIKILSNGLGSNASLDIKINSTAVKLGPFPQDKEFVKEIETELKIKDEQEKQQRLLNAAKDKRQGNDEGGDGTAVTQPEDDTAGDGELKTEKKALLEEYNDMKDINRGNRLYDTNESIKKDEGVAGSISGSPQGFRSSTTDTSVTTESKITGKSQPLGILTSKSDEFMKSPAIDTLPLPPKTALDIKLEIQKIKESRDAIQLENLQVAQPSVCMYTFHNTNRDMTCLEFSDDCRLAATGFQDSFIRIWSLDGHSLLTNKIPKHKRDEMLQSDSTVSTLIGHSGAVYSTSFSPDNRFLLSGSEDKTVRLWSLDTHTALVSYKGHNHPVWDVKFSPLGHYFATASHDQTARLWSCDHIYPLRIFAGHLNDVDTLCFHPNGCYVITGSSDKTCRMWDVSTGDSVRLFLGHTAPVISTAVTPDGRWLVSGSEDGIINIWDIGTGKRLKQMRGHGKNAIHSFSFNKEGNLLVSGGADQSVRVWNLKKATPEPSAEPKDPFVGYLGDVASSVNQDIKDYGRRRAVIPTNDLMSSFFTKRTPVFSVRFTRSNLVLAGGPYRD